MGDEQFKVLAGGTSTILIVAAKMCGKDHTYAPAGAYGAKLRRALIWSSVFYFLEEREAHFADNLLERTRYDLCN